MTGGEQLDRQAICQQVLVDLGAPVGACIESVTKEYVTNDCGWHLDYWHLVVLVPGFPALHVQYSAEDIPCEGRGTLYPATMLEYGACVTRWSAMPYALPFQA